MPARPPRNLPEDEGLDPVVFGPGQTPRNQVPAPVPQAPPPVPPRRPARRKGPVEIGVGRDLKLLPAQLRNGGIATAALRLARELDTGGLAPRDAAGHAREIRMALITLAELAPGEGRGDQTDEVRARRERRLAAGGE